MSLWLWARHSQHSLQSLHAMTLLFTAAGYQHPGPVNAEGNEITHTESSNLARSGFAKHTRGQAPSYMLQAPSDTPDTNTRGSTKVSSLSRAALSLPWMSQELMGLCVQWTPFLCQRLARDAARGAMLCSRQKAGVGPTSWTQGGRKP